MTNRLAKADLNGVETSRQVDTVPVPRSPGTRHRTKPCPFCAETIRYNAIKCRYCGEFLTAERCQAAAKLCVDQAEGETGLGGDESGIELADSDVLWSGRPSVLALAGTAARTVALLIVCWAVYHYSLTQLIAHIPKTKIPPAQLTQVEGWIDLAALGLALVGLLVLAWKIAALKSIHYEVTPDRIEWSRGIFDRHVDNIDMFRVVDLKLRRSLLECLLGIGTVVLITKDESDPQFEFVKVRRCRPLYDILKDANLKADKKRNVLHLD